MWQSSFSLKAHSKLSVYSPFYFVICSVCSILLPCVYTNDKMVACKWVYIRLMISNNIDGNKNNRDDKTNFLSLPPTKAVNFSYILVSTQFEENVTKTQ